MPRPTHEDIRDALQAAVAIRRYDAALDVQDFARDTRCLRCLKAEGQGRQAVRNADGRMIWIPVCAGCGSGDEVMSE